MFASLSRSATGIVDSVIELCWYMRGAIGYEEMMNRTPGERQRISKFIDNRMDKLKDAHFPVY